MRFSKLKAFENKAFRAVTGILAAFIVAFSFIAVYWKAFDLFGDIPYVGDVIPFFIFVGAFFVVFYFIDKANETKEEYQRKIDRLEKEIERLKGDTAN